MQREPCFYSVPFYDADRSWGPRGEEEVEEVDVYADTACVTTHPAELVHGRATSLRNPSQALLSVGVRDFFRCCNKQAELRPMFV